MKQETDFLTRTALACQRVMDEMDWRDGVLVVPTFLLKPRCDMCGRSQEPSEMVARIPAGTDLKAACLDCWNVDTFSGNAHHGF